ncbi:MAG: NADP-dependent oxidoreductase [Anaerolineales bacterium]|nr:NADP-dependent oxidoreductase [Anaerolineales bacterium]
MTTNQSWRIAARPQGRVQESDFAWVEEPVPDLAEGQVLVRNVYLSLDPTNRGWMGERATYLPPLPLGSVMRGITLGVVEASRDAGIQPGDIVSGTLGWTRYAVTTGQRVTRLPNLGVPLAAHFGLLGHIGLTAYFGLLEIGQPKPGETLVVSAAAGAVGSLVGQIGKIQGCHVVGIAGTDDKCRWITEDLGFDAAINYKTESVPARLRELRPRGIDIYFDNVGGDILDAALGQINLHGRVVLCGLISQYNATAAVPGPYNFPRILTQRMRVEGFIVLDYLDRAIEAYPSLITWSQQGKLQYRLHIVPGLEQAPAALNMLFDGTNQGKLLVQVSEEPGT